MSLIKSFSVGNGDMFYIKHGSSNFTIIDCYMCEDSKKRITDEIKRESKEKDITRFISTHPDEDHFHGLKYLDNEISILNFYCVDNETRKTVETEDFKRYCQLRDSDKSFYLYKDCTRKWMNSNDDEKNYGSSGINILWPIIKNESYLAELEKAKNGECPNNISPIIEYALNNSVVVLWFGDLEADFMEKNKDEITLPKADIIFAPHHGRCTGKIPKEWLDNIDPKIVVIGEAPSDQINYYAGYNTITQNSAGDIVFDCSAGLVDVYTSCESYSINYLENNHKENNCDCFYKGTLKL